MIELTTINGAKVFLAPATIMSVTEAGPSSQWHGVRAFVQTTHAGVIEARESAEEINRLIKATTE